MQVTNATVSTTDSIVVCLERSLQPNLYHPWENPTQWDICTDGLNSQSAPEHTATDQWLLVLSAMMSYKQVSKVLFCK